MMGRPVSCVSAYGGVKIGQKLIAKVQIFFADAFDRSVVQLFRGGERG